MQVLVDSTTSLSPGWAATVSDLARSTAMTIDELKTIVRSIAIKGDVTWHLAQSLEWPERRFNVFSKDIQRSLLRWVPSFKHPLCGTSPCHAGSRPASVQTLAGHSSLQIAMILTGICLSP